MDDKGSDQTPTRPNQLKKPLADAIGSITPENLHPSQFPEEVLEEWDLEDNPVPLPPLCDLCSGDATDGQSTSECVLCPDCLPERK